MKSNTDWSRPFGQRLVDRFTAGFVYSGHDSRRSGRLTNQKDFGRAEHKQDTGQPGQRSSKGARLRQRNVWTC